MDLVSLEQKYLATSWRQAETQRRARKKNRPVARRQKKEKTYFDLDTFSKALALGVARTILIASCFYGIFIGYRFITSSPYFYINHVGWFGNYRLTTDDLTSWVGPITEGNIFKVDLNKVSQKLATHPWVQTASVRRVFPQSLHIELKERVPFVRVKLDQVYVMDNYGILLGPDVKNFNELPLIVGISAKNPKPGNNVANEEIIRGLKTMYYINLLPTFKKNPIDTVRIINKSRVTFVTHNKNMEIHMRPGSAQESFKNLSLVLETMDDDERGFKYIDLSFKNKVVVKHKKNHKDINLEREMTYVQEK